MTEWIDNLIPIKAPALEGEQLAGWRPGEPALEGLGCRLLADQRIPVDDGVTLSADVYTPKRPGRYPAIVQFAAYSRELHTAGIPTGTNEIGSPPVFTDRGYAQVVVVRRGMDRSQGAAGPFFGSQEVDDYERCIAWAARQPWCDGSVVLFGTSYYAMTQLLVATRRPPALKAFFCNEVCTDYFRQILQFGGFPGLYFCNVWMGANFTEAVARLRVPPVVRALISHIANSRLKKLWQPFLMKRIDAVYRLFMSKTPIRSARESYVNWLFDSKTRDATSMPPGPYRDLSKIDAPFVVVQNLGYFNLHQFGCYDLFEHAGAPASRKWMILGPPRYELPVYAWQLEALAFFDHVVRGVDNGYAEQPRVRYWLDGADRFVGAPDFPVPGNRRRRLYLASRGSDLATHALQRQAPAAGENSWIAIPLGHPILGGLDEIEAQVLSFEWEIERDTHLAGPVSLRLSFSCNEIDSFIVARLGRVDADGSLHILSMGAISPARRRVDPDRGSSCEIAIDTQHPEPLTPGTPVELSFSLTPGPTRSRKGEKLRLDVASRTDLLKSDVSHGYVHFDIPAPPYFSRNKLHYGSQTYLEIDEIDDPGNVVEEAFRTAKAADIEISTAQTSAERTRG